MSITVTFNGYEEMMGFARQLIGEPQAEQKASAKEVKKNVITEETKTADVKDDALVEEEALPKEEVKTYTLEEVRAALAVVTRKGKQKEVKELLTSFGAKNLSGIDAKDYAALMEKAGKI